MRPVPDPKWPPLPDFTEPAPPRSRRAWGKLPHEERYRRQRRDLLRAAGRLAVEEGLSSTRVADIVREAEVSKSTFYEHFDSKEDCFVELYRRTSAAMLRAGIAAAEESAGKAPLESVLHVMRALVGYVEQAPRLAHVFRTEAGSSHPAIRAHRAENMRRIVALFITLGRRLGSTVSDRDLEMSGAIILHGVTALMPELERSEAQLDEDLRTIARVICRALGLPPDTD